MQKGLKHLKVCSPCTQVLDAPARESIPETVRWYHTVMHQQHVAAVLGPVSLATAPVTPASSGTGSILRGGVGKGKPAAKGDKAAAKPKQAQKPLANGAAAGKHLHCIKLVLSQGNLLVERGKLSKGPACPF